MKNETCEPSCTSNEQNNHSKGKKTESIQTTEYNMYIIGTQAKDRRNYSLLKAFFFPIVWDRNSGTTLYCRTEQMSKCNEDKGTQISQC